MNELTGADFKSATADDNKKLFIETYGCQMNVADSEVIASVMQMAGYSVAETLEEADAVFMNTCSIRDNAEQKILNRLEFFHSLKKKKKRLIVGVLGCMAERVKDDLITNHHVDLVVGPDAYLTLPDLIAAVEAGEKLGFLPGDMKEKLDPYLQPLYDALNDMIPPAKLAKYLEEGTVQIAPLAYMRGRTLDNAFVILDEAQNTTLSQIKMFLTRMGRNAKFIVTGDVTQIDLPRKSDSGLVRTMEILREVEGIGIVEFDVRDIVRHPLVKHIVEAFDKCGTDLSKVEK